MPQGLFQTVIEDLENEKRDLKKQLMDAKRELHKINVTNLTKVGIIIIWILQLRCFRRNALSKLKRKQKRRLRLRSFKRVSVEMISIKTWRLS